MIFLLSWWSVVPQALARMASTFVAMYATYRRSTVVLDKMVDGFLLISELGKLPRW